MGSTNLIAIKEAAAGLSPGQSIRTVCPWCGGGSNGERSFVVRATDSGIGFNCYRATCTGNGKQSGHIGGVVTDRGYSGVTQSTKYRELAPYTGELERLPSEVFAMFRERFGLTSVEVTSAGFRWAADEGRVYMPVYGPSGARRGSQLRSYMRGAGLKVIARPETHAPWQAWYRLGTGRPDGIVSPKVLVVVEDQVSALKASRHYHAVATLGTKLTDDRLMEIADIAPREVVFAMDGDATVKAIDMMADNMLLFERMHVAFLGKDFKDVPDAEIIERVKAAME